MDDTASAPALRELLDTLGEELVEVAAAPRGLGVAVTDVVILDPEDPLDGSELKPGHLVLVIGARGAATVPVIRAAAAASASAVAVKPGGDGPMFTELADEAGVAVLGVRGEARWERFEALARTVVEAARAHGAAETGEQLGDLFSLAQTTAALTGGIVTIEDTASRVLAYSSTGDEVDELRRLSILGRQGPRRYLAMLRDWGVYRRLLAGEGIVRVDERPDLGIRRRIAAGIHAGTQPLGAIWVQQAASDFTTRAERALLGAARTAALHLVRRRTQATADGRLRENLLAGLLDGRLSAEAVATEIAADAARPCVVVAFLLAEPADTPAAGRSELELHRAELVRLISVHVAAYRRSALVSTGGGRVYALLPETSPGAEGAVLTLARDVVAAAARHRDVRVRAAVGGVVDRLAEATASRADADRVLDAMTSRGGTGALGDVASLADMRSTVLFTELLALLAQHPRTRDPRLWALRRYDREHTDTLVPSLLAYLDAFGDAGNAARRLHIHPNTLRYRLRRAAEVSGIDLNDPHQRVLAQLQLRLPDDAPY